ncbi:MAG: hypothetical protein U0V74_09415 [Chitinophagales bacterium]
MKLRYSFLLFLLLPLAIMAQVVQLSNPIKLPAKAGKFKIIGKNNDGIIVRLYGSDDIINIFSDDLSLLASRTIDFKNKDGLLQYIMLNKTGAVVFYLQQDKKYSVLFAQPVNSKFIEIGKPVSIDTIYDRRDLVEQNLRFKASVDQNYLFIYYPFFAANHVQSVRYICLDRSLASLYHKNIPFDRDESEMETSRSLVDNSGSSYLILKKNSKEDIETFDVFRVSSNGDASIYSLTTPKKIFNEPYFEVDNKNNQLLLCSFYNDDARKEDVANGFIYSTFNPETGALVSGVTAPFPKTFINELTGREVKDKGNLYTFSIKKAMLRNDGGAMILAESFIKDTRETVSALGAQPGFNTYHSTSLYQFNDVIGFSFNPKGDLEWDAIMRKKQVSEEDNGAYSSFLIINQKDKLRLIYLDDASSSGSLNEYVLNSDGKNDRNVILNQEDKDLLLLPKIGKQISPDAVVIPSYKNGDLRLIKITY